MARYGRAVGLLVEPLGHLWAAFSPLSGETTLLNDESAAVLEVLESGANDTPGVCAALTEIASLDAERLTAAVEAGWPRLLEAGLVVVVPDAARAQ